MRATTASLLFAGLVALSGCTKTTTVTVPPKVDLQSWPVIGVVNFTADRHAELAPAATQKVIVHMQSAQSGVRILELGSKDKVLNGLGMNELDPVAVKAIGTKYGVQAVLIGQLDISDTKPGISISPDLSSASASAAVNGSLSAKLLETATGATVWSNAAQGKWSLGGVKLGAGGISDVGYSSAEDKYEEIVSTLASDATKDFRPTYETRAVD